MPDLPFPKSLPDFQRLFPDDAACAKYLEAIRFRDGFQCPHCQGRGEPGRIATRPHVLRCRNCRKETRLMAGTVMQDSHTPMSVWFWGAYLLSSLTPGMSAVQFQRQLGLTRYETAFQILHKLRAGMVRPERDRIGGEFPCEVDETYVGGKTRGEGKGVHHGIIVAGAVEVRIRKPKDPENKQHSKAVPRRGGRYAGRLRLAVVPNRKAKSLCRFVDDNVLEGTMTITDAWQGYASLQERGFDHLPVAERDEARIAEEYMPLIHLVFSNLKSWINGVHHGVDPQHLQAYCNEFTFRFNRRFYPFNSFRSLLGIAADSEAHTYAGLYAGRPLHAGEIRESA
jgi:ISXO2-like transposase domain/Transposase zinc-ribbon domain